MVKQCPITALTRGKNDKVDSQRIALYATKNIERLRLWKPMNATLEKIRHLASLRERLVETKKKLATPIKEFEDIGNIAMAKLLTKTIKSSLTAIDKDLKNIESKIIDIVNEDDKKSDDLVINPLAVGGDTNNSSEDLPFQIKRVYKTKRCHRCCVFVLMILQPGITNICLMPYQQ